MWKIRTENTEPEKIRQIQGCWLCAAKSFLCLVRMWKIRTLFCPITLLSGSDAENPNFVRLYHSFCLVRILKIRTWAVSSGSIIVASDVENPNWATEPEKFIALIWFLCGKSQLSPRNFVRFDNRFFGWKKFEISPIRFVKRSAKPYPAKFLSAQWFHAG